MIAGLSFAQLCRVNCIIVIFYSVALEPISFFNDNDLMHNRTVKMDTLTALNPLPLGFQVTILSGPITDS